MATRCLTPASPNVNNGGGRLLTLPCQLRCMKMPERLGLTNQHPKEQVLLFNLLHLSKLSWCNNVIFKFVTFRGAQSSIYIIAGTL